jgi:predicted acetyltransferase
MNSYIVGIKSISDDKLYTLLLDKQSLGYLLLHIDEEKYIIGDIIITYSERKDSILQFCIKDKDLETGNNEGVK